MTKKLISVVLALTTLLGLISMISCTQTKKEEPKKTLLADNYTVVVGEELFLAESSAANTLSQSLANEGITATLHKDGEEQKSDFEILLGQTDREESKAAYEKINGVDDFVVDLVSEKLIVICGKTPRATEQAVNYFLSEYIRAGTGEFKKEPFVLGKSIYRHEYKYENVMLKDIPIKDYVIAVDDDKDMKTAYRVAYTMGAFSGELVKIIKYDEIRCINKGVVCIGANGRNPDRAYPKDLDGYFLNLETDDDEVTLSVLWTDEKYYETAMSEFEKRFAVSGEEKYTEARFTSITKTDIEGDSRLNETEWVVVSQIDREVTKGVTQTSYNCVGFKKLPYLVHVMTVDLNYVDIMLGTADNRNDTADKWIQTPIEHGMAAEKAGAYVYGAINAGYPTGISVKEGKQMVKGTIHRPYFALFKNGTPKILYDDNAAPVSAIELAACGTDIIIEDYMPTDLEMTKEFNFTTHPRTLLGIRGDGVLVMVVIDGRQPELSNGAPFTRCADIMMRLGCKIAINFDGGGSSSMYVKNAENVPLSLKTAEIVNKISDPTMRKVRNSILIVAKKDK